MDTRLRGEPSEEYGRRLGEREARVAQLQARHIWLGNLRLLLVTLLVVLVWSSVVEAYTSRWLLGVPVLLFIGTAIDHSRVLRRQARARRAADIYRRGLARIEDRWAGTNPREVRDGVGASLYAADLDIVGRDGLFELLCMARTRMGEDTLLRWLLEPAALHEILERQEAIGELAERLDFRERMAVAGDTAAVGVEAAALREWAVVTESPELDVLTKAWLPWLAAALAMCALAAAVLWLRGGTAVPLILLLFIEAGVVRVLKRPMGTVLPASDRALREMRLLSALLQEMEREDFRATRLRGIAAKLSAHPVRSSAAIAQLGTLARYKESLDNPFVKLMNVPLLYSVQLACAIQRWRRLHGGAVPAWLDAVGEMEALLSLATYRYEHPGDPFPTLLEGGACLRASELGHPLIPAERCVRNSVTLCDETRMLLISGSNMSGKSTLMRTVGINVVLAMCGAPVRASGMELTPMRLGASLLVNDSLQGGHSRFYAEIEKLQRICRLAEESSGLPVLFLLDELLQGTNSTDRLIGARGIVRALRKAGAIGILTTHDLSLTELAGSEDGGIRNMHFQDQIVDGRMQFDFRLRNGVVSRSNGVALMRMIGLDV